MHRDRSNSSRLRLKNKRGFTLVEILMAMMLLGATGVSILGAFSNSSRLTQTPENAGYYLASKQLAAMNASVRNDQWANAGLPLSLVNHSAINPNPETVGTVVYTQTYTINDNGAAYDNNGDGIEDYRKARVTVSWP